VQCGLCQRADSFHRYLLAGHAIHRSSATAHRAIVNTCGSNPAGLDRAAYRFLPELDQLVRPIVLEGVAPEGVSLTRQLLAPGVTVSARGVPWHAVAANHQRFLVTRIIEPLTPVLATINRLFGDQWVRAAEAAALFPCALRKAQVSAKF
jgi:hypothetical protein